MCFGMDIMGIRTYSGLRGTACDIFEDEQRASKWMRVDSHSEFHENHP